MPTTQTIYLLNLFSYIADFGDFNRYDSQDFLQKFVLFPIVSLAYFNLTFAFLSSSLALVSFFTGLDPGWANPGRGHSESGSCLSVLQVSGCSRRHPVMNSTYDDCVIHCRTVYLRGDGLFFNVFFCLCSGVCQLQRQRCSTCRRWKRWKVMDRKASKPRWICEGLTCHPPHSKLRTVKMCT